MSTDVGQSSTFGESLNQGESTETPFSTATDDIPEVRVSAINPLFLYSSKCFNLILILIPKGCLDSGRGSYKKDEHLNNIA